MIRCGNKVHQALNAGPHAHHHSVAQVKVCQMVRPVLSVEEQALNDWADAIFELEMRS